MRTLVKVLGAEKWDRPLNTSKFSKTVVNLSMKQNICLKWLLADLDMGPFSSTQPNPTH